MLGRIDGGRVEFISRNQQKWTSRLNPLVRAVKRLPVKQALLDGEVVAIQADGTSDFQALQNAFRDSRVQELQYYVFDLLYLDGYSLVDAPLEERKRVLADVLAAAGPNRALRYSDHVDGKGSEFVRRACKLHLEGIVSKRRDRPYRGGRGYDWLKVKCVQNEEFVIGGYTAPSGSREGFGALLIGSYDDDGQFIYAGKVGTGFNAKTLRSLLARLKTLEQPESPFNDLRRMVGPVRTAHWVKPTLVAQITYGNRTRDGLLRHPSFQGLREDKPAREVTPVEPVSVRDALQRSQKATSRTRFGATKAAAMSRSKRGTGERATGAAVIEGYVARKQEFHKVRLTSPDKVLYPEQGITKLELASYYRGIADWILRHLVHRPLAIVRCPEGRAKECFYQKHPGVGTPETLRQISIREKNKAGKYVVVDDVEGLISLAQVGALEIHAWGSREDKLDHPDRLVFDLDPDPQVPWQRVIAGARQVRAFLQELGLESFVKTTGGKGLHLVVPIERRHEWDEAKAFCKLVAETIVSADPTHYTANMAKSARTGKILIDYLRNGRGATAIVPYSPRARPGATVSAPLTWRELSARTGSDRFTIRNIFRRLALLKQDPWEGFDAARQGLSGPLKKLRSLGVK